MIPEPILNLPWGIIDTLISFLELLILCIPASVAFVYYRLCSVSVRPLDITLNGATFLIHNKTNRTVFITDIFFVVLSDGDFNNPVVSFEKTMAALKPDDHIEVIANYTKKGNKKQSFKLVVCYDRRKRKKIKVTI